MSLVYLFGNKIFFFLDLFLRGAWKHILILFCYGDR